MIRRIAESTAMAVLLLALSAVALGWGALIALEDEPEPADVMMPEAVMADV